MPETAPAYEAQTVAEIVAADYRTAAVFEKHAIDFCCGDVAFAAVCQERGIEQAALARELEAAKSTPPRRDQDYATWTLTRLISHIKTTHHGYLRENTGRIGAYARKIDEVHGAQHPELAEIVVAFEAVAAELTAHLRDEEEALFPAIKRAEAAAKAGEAPTAQDAATISRLVETLTSEHEQIGGAVHDIRDLAMGYGLPGDACATYVLTYQNLQKFEADLHKHVHLENNILFPRAARMWE